MSGQFLGMSDDDFLKLNPGSLPEENKTENPGETPDNPLENKNEGDNPPVENPPEVPNEDPPADEPPAPAGSHPPEEPGENDPAAQTAKTETPVADPAGSEKKDPAADPTGQKVDPKVEPETPVEPDYKAFYEGVIGKPIKANGKEIVLKTPEEVTRMIQMGAGFGRKLQEIQPHLKTLKMLEKNNLLDESKLSYLIDIQNKNPDAIKKLIKESGIDPLDLSNEDNVVYTPQNHSVSDEEMAFDTAIKDLTSSDTGRETINLIHRDWDQASKNLLFQSPELLGIIQEQRDTGIYDQITAEIDRQKLLGKIAPTTPFLQAYKVAGDHLTATNGFRLPAASDPVVQPEPKVIATRVATPKPQVTNSDKAQAASPTRSSNRKASTDINPLAMADDDFLKTMNGRL